MNFFDPKLNLKVKLNNESSNNKVKFDFKLENLTPDYSFSNSDVNITSNIIEVGTSEFTNNTKVKFTTLGILPAPLNTSAEYFIIDFISGSPNSIKISNTSNGIPIVLTSAGSGTSFIKSIIDTSNYRVVSYHNLRWPVESLIIISNQANITSGSTDGILDFNVSSKFYNNEEYPPRLLPLNGRFTYRAQSRFTQASLIGFESSFENISISFKHISDYVYLTYDNGLLEYQVGNSYSSTSATNYEDNSKFILEFNNIDIYNNDSINWVPVQEYTTSATTDTNTGLHPYGNKDKDTTIVDNILLPIGKDSEIRYANPDSNYVGDIFLSVFNDNGSINNRRRSLLSFLTSEVYSNNISKAELWLYADNLTDNFNDNISINKLSATWQDNNVTWNNANSLFGQQIAIFDPIVSGSNYSSGYTQINIATSAIQPLITSAVSNYGLGLKYDSEGTENLSEPLFYSSNVEDTYKQPFLAISLYNSNSVSANLDILYGQINSEILNPIIISDINNSVEYTSISACMLNPYFVGYPQTSAYTSAFTIESLILQPYIGTTSGLPVYTQYYNINSEILQPEVYSIFNNNITSDRNYIYSQFLQPLVNTQINVPVITFGLANPLNKNAILPNGIIQLPVFISSTVAINASNVGLTSNSLSGAKVISATQVNTNNVNLIVSISALDNENGQIEVSARNSNNITSISADYNYFFNSPVTNINPVVIITNSPSNKIIDPDPVYVTVQVISPGFVPLNNFGLMPGSIGTIISAGMVNSIIPYPNYEYIIEVSSTGNLLVSANDIYENFTSASDGLYINYNETKYESGREINLVNFLPNHLRISEVGTFIKFFEDFLNHMYLGQNSSRYDENKVNNDNYKVSILEKIYRLSNLHDPDLIDMDYIQFFANYMGYSININRGDIGNLTNADLTSISTNVNEDDNTNIFESELSRRYLRFAVQNLPTWYRIKTTRDSIKVMLFSFGLVGDILTKYTAPIEKDGYSNNEKWLTYDDRYSDSSLYSQIPGDWFGTSHFDIAIDYDNSPVNWFKQLPIIIDAIESIRPINTVLDQISTVLKRKLEKINVKAVSRINSSSFHTARYILSENTLILSYSTGESMTYTTNEDVTFN